MPEFVNHLGNCPACGRQFGDHQFSLLASVPVKQNDDPRVRSFLNAIENHDWPGVLSFQQWEGGHDDYELYGIRAKDHPVVLVTIWDPFELFYNERIIETEVLNEVDSSELLTLARGKEWKTSAEIV